MTHPEVVLAIARATRQRDGMMPRYGWLYRPEWQALRREMVHDPATADSPLVFPLPALIVCGVPLYPREAPEPVIEFDVC